MRSSGASNESAKPPKSSARSWRNGNRRYLGAASAGWAMCSATSTTRWMIRRSRESSSRNSGRCARPVSARWLHSRTTRARADVRSPKPVRRQRPPMTDPQPDLDVAISFEGADRALAVTIRDGLAGSLKVFEFTDRQEELAGTDGLESLRWVFHSRARLVVILMRATWGTTWWTRVEMEAI